MQWIEPSENQLNFFTFFSQKYSGFIEYKMGSVVWCSIRLVIQMSWLLLCPSLTFLLLTLGKSLLIAKL
jgi:hypothetical protein